MPLDERFYLPFAAAYARSTFPALVAGLEDDEAVVRAALEEGIDLYRLKRTALPRVSRVVGFMRAVRPDTVVDLGTGRGAFLWPLLEALPEARVTCVERSEHHIELLSAVRDGGIERLDPRQMDVTSLALDDDSADVVTVLEVLEHLDNPSSAAAEAARVARRYVVASVPSKEDDNPEHIHFFTVADLEGLLFDAGAERVDIEHVLNHRIAIAHLAPGRDAS